MNVSQTARYNMIDGQLEPNQVLDEKIVAAMGITPREAFVPEAFAANAYVDSNISLGHGRHMMPPVVLGRLLQAAEIDESCKVLVLGAATGYTAMVVAHLGAKVVVVEEQRELADKARQILSELSLKEIEIKTAALHLGCEGQGPYDVIIVDGAVEELPDNLFKQLADNGRVLTIRNVATRPGKAVGLGKAVKLVKSKDGIQEQELFDASVPVIPSFKAVESFTF